MRDLIGEANALVADEEPEKARPPCKDDLRRRKKARRSNMQKALGLYEEAVRENPGDERGYCGAVLMLVAAGRFADAAPYLERLIRLRPDAAYPHGMMGCVMEMTGRTSESVACYDRMIEADPDEMFGRLRKSVVLAMLDENERARECLDELFGAEPRGASAAKDQEKIRDILEYDGPEGEDDFNENLMPGLAKMWGTLVSKDADLPEGIFPEDIGALARAAADPDDEAAADPDSEDENRIGAMMMLKDGRYAESIEYLDKVLRLRPDGVVDLGLKGMMLEELGRPDEALGCYERIIEVEPGDMTARHRKCGVLARRGEAERVLECYRAALEAEPSNKAGARTKRGMREEYRELARCAKEAGSVESGFAKFMQTTGVEPGRAPGRRGAGGRLRAGRRRR